MGGSVVSMVIVSGSPIGLRPTTGVPWPSSIRTQASITYSSSPNAPNVPVQRLLFGVPGSTSVAFSVVTRPLVCELAVITTSAPGAPMPPSIVIPMLEKSVKSAVTSIVGVSSRVLSSSFSIPVSLASTRSGCVGTGAAKFSISRS